MSKFGVLSLLKWCSSFTTIIFLCLILFSTSVESKKCRALVLEGGGDKGAYQAGVIRGMYERLGQEGATYDVVSGVSIGAINGLAYSLHKPGHEDEATQWLCKSLILVHPFQNFFILS